MEVISDEVHKWEDGEYKANPPHLAGVADMSELIYLDEPHVLENLDMRYSKLRIYTAISNILVAMNPYQVVTQLYNDDTLLSFKMAIERVREPHVFNASKQAYQSMVKTHVNQSMVICGESGAGKTETAKYVMRYLAAQVVDGQILPTHGGSVEERVLAVNPILEAFGNSKTALNNNSSRFGKFTKLVFDRSSSPKVIGSFIETYLLEKSRVVRQSIGERNFHIFYWLMSASVERCNYACIQPTSYFRYFSTDFAEGKSSTSPSDIENLQDLDTAFRSLGMPEAQIQDIYRLVSAVLYLGNLAFKKRADDYCEISPSSAETLATCASLLGVNAERLKQRVETRSIQAEGRKINKSLSERDIHNNRDAIAKEIYDGLFLWLVRESNSQLYKPEVRDPGLNWIGILDVFGFENFQHNSFEQFCINFANERLQDFFNNCILISEQKEYIAEAIFWTPLTIPDNRSCIDLVLRATSGIVAVLDSAGKTPQATDKTFTDSLFNFNKYHKNMKRILTKAAKDGSSRAVYDAEGFLAKNADQTHEDTRALLCSSTWPVHAQILADEAKEKLDQPQPKEAKDVKETQGVKRMVRPTAKAAPQEAQKSSSVAFNFMKQLSSLLKTLESTTPFFIRCIKPNSRKLPNQFDWSYIRPQLRAQGLVEALKILKCGFPSRTTYDNVFARYGSVLGNMSNLNRRDFTEAILRVCGKGLSRESFQLGLTKVFFRAGSQEFLEDLLNAADEGLPPVIVMHIRRFLLNKRFTRVKGTISVHVAFARLLNRQRAWKRWKFALSYFLIGMRAFKRRLSGARYRIAAATLQALARAVLGRKSIADKRTAVYRLGSAWRSVRVGNKVAKWMDAQVTERRRLAAEARAKAEAEAKAQRRLDIIAHHSRMNALAATDAEAARKARLEAGPEPAECFSLAQRLLFIVQDEGPREEQAAWRAHEDAARDSKEDSLTPAMQNDICSGALLVAITNCLLPQGTPRETYVKGLKNIDMKCRENNRKFLKNLEVLGIPTKLTALHLATPLPFPKPKQTPLIQTLDAICVYAAHVRGIQPTPPPEAYEAHERKLAAERLAQQHANAAVVKSLLAQLSALGVAMAPVGPDPEKAELVSQLQSLRTSTEALQKDSQASLDAVNKVVDSLRVELAAEADKRAEVCRAVEQDRVQLENLLREKEAWVRDAPLRPLAEMVEKSPDLEFELSSANLTAQHEKQVNKLKSQVAALQDKLAAGQEGVQKIGINLQSQDHPLALASSRRLEADNEALRAQVKALETLLANTPTASTFSTPISSPVKLPGSETAGARVALARAAELEAQVLTLEEEKRRLAEEKQDLAAQLQRAKRQDTQSEAAKMEARAREQAQQRMRQRYEEQVARLEADKQALVEELAALSRVQQKRSDEKVVTSPNRQLDEMSRMQAAAAKVNDDPLGVNLQKQRRASLSNATGALGVAKPEAPRSREERLHLWRSEMCKLVVRRRQSLDEASNDYKRAENVVKRNDKIIKEHVAELEKLEAECKQAEIAVERASRGMENKDTVNSVMQRFMEAQKSVQLKREEAKKAVATRDQAVRFSSTLGKKRDDKMAAHAGDIANAPGVAVGRDFFWQIAVAILKYLQEEGEIADIDNELEWVFALFEIALLDNVPYYLWHDWIMQKVRDALASRKLRQEANIRRQKLKEDLEAQQVAMVQNNAQAGSGGQKGEDGCTIS